MASRRPFTYPRFQAFDSNGAPLSGGTAEFFDAGTTTNRDIYSDAALTTTAPNPVTLNSRGEPESGGGTAIDVYLDNEPYKIVLKDSSGSTIWTIDNYIAIQDITEPEDPADATDQSTDVFEGVLNRDPTSGEIFKVDFQSANTTTAPTFENTGGTLGALTVKTRDSDPLWVGALNRVHELLYDGTDLLVLDPNNETHITGTSPEHATDGGTDAFASATNTGQPSTGQVIVRDFQSANTTTTPTLDGRTITDIAGNALWAGALNRVHEFLDDGTNYRLISSALDGQPPESATTFTIGSLMVVQDDITGAEAPDNSGTTKWIKLTAGETGAGQYNEGLLTSESVSGSSPTITATATISHAASPMDGQTVRLVNTEERFLRAGNAGTTQDSEFKSHKHDIQVEADTGAGTNYVRNHFDGLNSPIMKSDAIQLAGGTETRPRNIGITHYMRIA